MAGIRPFRSERGGEQVKWEFPLGPNQTFDPGDPVYLSSQQVTEAPQDDTGVLDTELFGFAGESAIGVSQVGGVTQPASGTENEFRSIILPTLTQVFITANLFPSPVDGTRARPTGADILAEWQLGYDDSAGGIAEWGLLETTGTIDTNAVAQVVGVYTDRGGTALGGTLGPGDPIDADDTTTGVWVAFRIIGNNQFNQSVAT